MLATQKKPKNHAYQIDGAQSPRSNTSQFLDWINLHSDHCVGRCLEHSLQKNESVSTMARRSRDCDAEDREVETATQGIEAAGLRCEFESIRS